MLVVLWPTGTRASATADPCDVAPCRRPLSRSFMTDFAESKNAILSPHLGAEKRAYCGESVNLESGSPVDSAPADSKESVARLRLIDPLA
eukprot:531279-Pyramimonas_sp.AAC.1